MIVWLNAIVVVEKSLVMIFILSMKNLIVIIARYCFKNSQSRPVRQDMDAAAPLYPKILLKIKDIAPSGGSLFTSEFPHRRAIDRIPEKGTVERSFTGFIFGLWRFLVISYGHI